MEHKSIEQQFAVALEALVEQIKRDRSVLAAILCGSLSHDRVWAKSDIDLVLVTIDDQIEHNMDVIKTADHVIDLGPEGGHAGGEVVAAGTPEDAARCKASHTGRFLKAHLRARGSDFSKPPQASDTVESRRR